MERGLEGGQRPHNRPLSPARRAQGERHGKKGRKRKDAGWSHNEQHHAPPRPPGVLVFQQKLRFRNTRTCRHGIAWRGDQTKRFVFTLPAVPPGRGLGASQVVPAPRQSLRRRAGVRTKGNPLVVTSCRPPCGDGCVRPPVPKAKLWLEQAGSEHRASARGKGGDSGGWKGASKGGNAPITSPFPPPGGHKG